MVAKQPSIPTKFSALQYRGVEFDTKPCSELENVPNLHAEIRQVAEGAQDESDPGGRLAGRDGF
jgi:hypothetical protein